MIGTSLYLLQERFIFLPTKLAQDYQYNFKHSFNEVFLKPESGVLINAIHFKANNPRGVILYFHGNAGDLSRWGRITSSLVDLDYDVFVMDYRTYGKSKGELSERALYSDAQFCYEYLRKLYDESDIIVYGRSLGTGIASYLGAHNKPKNIILETPYYSILDVAKKRFPFLPVSWLITYKVPTYQYLRQTHCKVLIMHGTSDKVVPFSSSLKLKALQLPNVSFVAIKNGGHNNLKDFTLYHDTIKSWLK